MTEPKYEIRLASANPELFVMVWVEDGIAILTDAVQMTEPELRAALTMRNISASEIDQVLYEARQKRAA